LSRVDVSSNAAAFRNRKAGELCPPAFDLIVHMLLKGTNNSPETYLSLRSRT